MRDWRTVFAVVMSLFLAWLTINGFMQELLVPYASIYLECEPDPGIRCFGTNKVPQPSSPVYLCLNG